MDFIKRKEYAICIEVSKEEEKKKKRRKEEEKRRKLEAKSSQRFKMNLKKKKEYTI